MEWRKAIFIKFYMDLCCYAKCVTHLWCTICCICKETVTSIAPEDGRVSPKHVELKVHK